jgi:predicted MPP superfamily phosphohydrolase
MLSIVMHIVIFIAKKGFGKTLKIIGLFVIALSIAISLVSFYPPKIFAVKNYDIVMNKKDSKLNSLRIVYVSDAHVGCSVKKSQLRKIRNKVNNLKPDVFLLDGDIFDEGSSEHYKRQAVSILSGIKTRFGSYYVEGNHDNYGKLLRRNTLDAFEYFKGTNIKPLNDEMNLVANSFYVVGRRDVVHSSSPRLSFDEFEKDMKKNLPVFVFDHRAMINETKNRDLTQLSGHTHNGQIFPANTLDPLKLTNIYGKYKRNKMQLIISSGVGTYGIPNRLGNFSEIVNIDIAFE